MIAKIPLHWLYKVRSWIDRRVPRDKLLIEIRDNRGRLLWSISHMEAILAAKMNGGVIEHQAGHIRMTLRVEHLSV